MPIRSINGARLDETASVFTATLLIVAFDFVLCVYAGALNHLFYSQFGPFFDSLYYHNRLAALYQRSSAGDLSGYADDMISGTVVLPWLVLFPLSRIMELDRAVGVWIQFPLVVAAHVSGFYYFLTARKAGPTESALYSLPFVTIAAVFYFNGGLADLRMDLSQYLAYAAVMFTLMIARNGQSNTLYAVNGLALAALLLTRATSPVYAAPLYLGFLLFDIVQDKTRWRIVFARYLIPAGMAAVLAGWFYLVNLDLLYNYYFILNSDAIAGLPLSESIAHFGFAWRSIGWAMGAAAIVTCVLIVVSATWQSWQAGGATPRSAMQSFNLAPIFFAAVPIGYLVLSGAGKNPFVAMLGASGLLLALIDPVRDRMTASSSARAVGALALGIAAAVNVWSGVPNHTDRERIAAWIPEQAGIREVVTTIQGDATDWDGNAARVWAPYAGSFEGSLLSNVLAFDDYDESPSAPKLGLAEVPRPAQYVEWMAIPGNSDYERVAWLVAEARGRAEYAVVPAEGTNLVPHVAINRFTPAIVSALIESGGWHTIAGPIRISPTENVMILRR